MIMIISKTFCDLTVVNVITKKKIIVISKGALWFEDSEFNN